MRPLLPVIVACALALSLGAACGSEGRGIDACERIETARCQRAPACGIDLPGPYAAPVDNVDNCISFYKVQCLHGLVSGDSPRPSAIDACVAAIEADCGAVRAPESSPACAFLVPTDAGTTDSGK